MSQTWLRKLFLLTCLTIINLAAFSQQKYKLANEYYNSGEYEKAAHLYEALYKESPGNKSYFNLYIQCLLDLKDYNNAKDIIESEIKKNL